MDPIEGVRTLLPAWLAWSAGLWSLPAGFAIGWLTTTVATWVALPRARRWREAHWTERARLTLPARSAASLVPILAAGVMASIVSMHLGPLAVLPGWATGALAAAAAYLGGAWAAARVVRRTAGERRGALGHAAAELSSLLILAPTLLGLGAMLALVRGEWSVSTLVGMALGVIGIGVGSVWAGAPLARVLGLLHPASERTRRAVARAAARTGVIPRAVFEVGLPVANAAALPIPGWLVFTRPCVEVLDDEELEAIACHELGHVSEPRGVKVVRVAGALGVLPVGFAVALAQAFGALAGLLIVLGLLLAVVIPVGVLRKRMEVRADAVAHASDLEEGVYARALERLYRRNHLPAVMWSRRTVHPHLYDRLLAAGIAPGYPRPAPPSSRRLVAGVLAACLVILVTVPPVVLPRPFVMALTPSPKTRGLVSIALLGGSRWDLFDLALHYAGEGTEDAVAVMDLLATMEPASHEHGAYRAELLARLGRCHAARAALEGAREAARACGCADTEEDPWLASARSMVGACEATAPDRLAVR